MAFNITSNILGAINAIANIGTEKNTQKQENAITQAKQEAEIGTYLEQTDIPIEYYKDGYSQASNTSQELENKWKKNPSKSNFNKFKDAQEKTLKAEAALQERLKRLGSNRERVNKYMQLIKGGNS